MINDHSDDDKIFLRLDWSDDNGRQVTTNNQKGRDGFSDFHKDTIRLYQEKHIFD